MPLAAARPVWHLLRASRLAGVLVAVGLALPALAAAEPAYVFLIDDSGSMAGAKVDPDRLAVFAVRALLQALDPADYATVVRLNEAADDKDRALPLLPLTEGHRNKLLERVTAAGTLASYSGSSTPCQGGFERVAERIREHAERYPDGDVHVFYLTDGACTDEATRRALHDLLRGVAPKKGALHLRLLSLPGRDRSPWLQDLAADLRGGAHEVDSTRLGGVLEAFAEALGASRGSKPKVVHHETVLDAHPAASWVTLIAIAKDNGRDLAVSVRDGEGSAAKNVELQRLDRDADRGAPFRFAGAGRGFRLFVGRYKGADAAAPQVAVEGADEWTLIQLPDYRLRVDMRSYGAADCLDWKRQRLAGETNQVPIGQSACVAVRVLDAHGQVVRGLARLDVGLDAAPVGDAAAFDAQPEAWKTRHGARHISNQCANGRAECRTELRCEKPGRLALHPWVVLQAGDSPRLELGPGGGIDCIDDAVTMTPKALRFEALITPGTRTTDVPPMQATVSGTFAGASARFTLPGSKLPACVHVRLEGKRAGERFEVARDRPMEVSVVADPWCGATTTEKLPFDIDVSLHLKAAGWSEEKSLTFRVAFDFQNVVRIERSDPELRLRAGDPVRVGELRVTGNHRQPVEFKAALSGLATDGDLRVGPANDDGTNVRFTGDGDKRAPVRKFDYTLGNVLRLATTSSACCGVGAHPVKLRLTPTAAMVGGGKAEALTVPVAVQVTDRSWFACWLPWILWGLAAVLAAVLLWGLWRLVFGVRRLDAKKLPGNLRNRMTRVLRDRTGQDEHRTLGHEDERTSIVPSWQQQRPGALRHFFENPGHAFQVAYCGARLHETVRVELGNGEPTSKVKVLSRRWALVPASGRESAVAVHAAAANSIVAYARERQDAIGLAIAQSPDPGQTRFGDWTLQNGTVEAGADAPRRVNVALHGITAEFRGDAGRITEARTVGWYVELP